MFSLTLRAYCWNISTNQNMTCCLVAIQNDVPILYWYIENFGELVLLEIRKIGLNVRVYSLLKKKCPIRYLHHLEFSDSNLYNTSIGYHCSSWKVLPQNTIVFNSSSLFLNEEYFRSRILKWNLILCFGFASIRTIFSWDGISYAECFYNDYYVTRVFIRYSRCLLPVLRHVDTFHSEWDSVKGKNDLFLILYIIRSDNSQKYIIKNQFVIYEKNKGFILWEIHIY